MPQSRKQVIYSHSGAFISWGGAYIGYTDVCWCEMLWSSIGYRNQGVWSIIEYNLQETDQVYEEFILNC